MVLGDYVNIILGGTPKTSNPEYWGGGIPWVTPGDICGEKYIDSTAKTITEKGISNSNTKLLEVGDVIISARGSVGKIIECDKRMAFNQSCYALRSKSCDKLAPAYIYYLLHSCVQYLKKNVTGAVFDTITMSTLARTPVNIPTIKAQTRIASILSAYDDLIENNRRRIQLLEQAARLLYKEWFVHLRFPGHENSKITNGLPEGWRKKPLCEIANITMGQSPKSIYYNEDGNGLPFHQGVTNFGARFPTHKTYCTANNRIAEPGDILFSVRAPVGRINISLDKIIIGRGLSTICSNCDQQNLLFYTLKNHFFKEDMIGSGAIFAAITAKDLREVVLVKPSNQIAKMFMEYVQPMDRQIKFLHQTTQALMAARDLLLTRLINGKVAV